MLPVKNEKNKCIFCSRNRGGHIIKIFDEDYYICAKCDSLVYTLTMNEKYKSDVSSGASVPTDNKNSHEEDDEIDDYYDYYEDGYELSNEESFAVWEDSLDDYTENCSDNDKGFEYYDGPTPFSDTPPLHSKTSIELNPEGSGNVWVNPVGPIPEDIRKKMEQEIIGQDAAIKTMAVAVYNHMKRINDKSGLIRKDNILLLGPSGSGKTLIARKIAEILNVPFTIADATSLTEAGYTGEDVETILTSLLSAADYDVAEAEKGIVFIDEIDKIARKGDSGSSRDVSGEGVQHALLKLIEGADINVPVPSDRIPHKTQKINTENILFICAGAFEGLIKTENTDKKLSIGFASSAEKEKSKDNEPQKITSEDLVEFGIIPELIGRLPVIVKLNDLGEKEMVRILKQPSTSIIKEYQARLKLDRVDLEFTDDALLWIAQIALAKHVGARGLRSIMDQVMEDLMYKAPSLKNSRKIIVTKKYVSERLGISDLAGASIH